MNHFLRTLCLAFLLLLTACGTTETSSSSKQGASTSPLHTEEAEKHKSTVPAEVIRVIDGDTIKVNVNNKEETVRFLLVDTPESVHPTKPIQPFGPEASQLTKKLLTGKKVELELDVSERDKYGRLLAYVYVDGKSVQEELLKKGLARVAYVFAPNTKYVDRYRKIERAAREKGIGIWSLENYVQEDGFHPKKEAKQPKEPLETEDHPSGCNIKGNISTHGDKIYHVPGGRYYRITKPEQWFCTVKEAERAGFRRSAE
ncbi:thermonuclease family protein [Fictibacillus gelatini]|uniref:thermonuclease family protein n=1 Tax=Fictibacillus gelatini TaxID=225985 RepID=UPI0004184F62|nr:thermonuclease family protein [Fictibacillus gelatini]